jgi:hypothetical protein
MSEPQLPPQLEARIAAFEEAPTTTDFDGPSWIWMMLWGGAVPLIMLVVGWWV